jgi:hypothetical protein
MFFLEMNSTLAAACVSGAIASLATIANLVMIHRSQQNKQEHERKLTALTAALATTNEAYKSELLTGLREREAVLSANLETFKKELEIRSTVVAPQVQKVRDHLTRTRLLLPKVYVSFDRLARLAPTLQEGQVLAETTNTLDLYAEYSQHLSSDEFVSYSVELKRIVSEIQERLARIFLDLQIDDDSRAREDQAEKMRIHLDELRDLKDRAVGEIEDVIRVHV